MRVIRSGKLSPATHIVHQYVSFYCKVTVTCSLFDTVLTHKGYLT